MVGELLIPMGLFEAGMAFFKFLFPREEKYREEVPCRFTVSVKIIRLVQVAIRPSHRASRRWLLSCSTSRNALSRCDSRAVPFEMEGKPFFLSRSLLDSIGAGVGNANCVL